MRINESRDDHDFYVRTNQIAHALDDSRQTGGVRFNYQSERLEDVFTMNDFQPDELREPNHPRFFNTEFVGHMFPTKHFDNVERVQEHVRRHAHVHNILGSDATRVVFRVTDEYGNPRPFATGAVTFQLDGPVELIGDNPFPLTGGVGAVWLKATETAGTIRLTATHPTLGPKTVELSTTTVSAEPC